MTPAQTPPVVESVDVTQADRIAASKIMISRQAEQDTLDGKIDRNPVIQSFARHRLAAYEAGRAEGVRAAAEVADASADHEGPFTEYFKGRDQGCHDAASAIRALSKEPTK